VLSIRPALDSDRPFLRAYMREHWGTERMVGRGRVFYPAEHPALIAEQAGEVAGVVTYEISGLECEVTMLHSLRPGQGVGGGLMRAAVEAARAGGCRRVWLITTNDNLHALKFYQKRGFRLAFLRPGAVDQARKIKPELPATGANGIPLRDELELELILEDR
jgi:ribosomal protein S18 acetylase RimI-like enzyme